MRIWAFIRIGIPSDPYFPPKPWRGLPPVAKRRSVTCAKRFRCDVASPNCRQCAVSIWNVGIE